MIRHLKALGVALVAVCAMSAFAASAASADTFTSTVDTVVVTGSQKTANVFTTTAGVVQCTGTTFKGTVVVPTTKTTEVRVAPTYTGCTGFGFPATIHTNGCEYVLKINDVVAGDTTGTVDIECPVGNEITVTAIGAGTTKCTVHIPTQTNIKGITYSNTGVSPTKEVLVTVDITNEPAGSGITYRHTEGTGLGKCTSGHGFATYTGSVLATGETTEGAHTDIFVD